jgi:tartrate-resistant acid phosphatase type 5
MTHLNRRTFVTGSAAVAATVALQPVAATVRPPALDFLVVGDWGRDGASHQRDVGAAMGERAEQTGARFVVTTGDNFYENGVESVDDPKWRTSFEDVYTAKALQRRWYGVLGNHDYRGNPAAQLDYGTKSARWHMPSRYYTVSGATMGIPGVDLFMIDSSPLVNKYRDGAEEPLLRANVMAQDTAAQLAWLDDALGRSQAAWKLVFTHHPAYSGGSSHGNTAEMIGQVEPILQRHGVQALVFGHDHDLQHIVRDGLHHIGTGAGSSVRPVNTVEGTQFCLSRSGFARVEVDPDTLRLEFRDYNGRQVYQTAIGRMQVSRAG